MNERPLGELSESGLLWLINRTVFHPRGMSLAVHRTGKAVTGWSLIATPNGDPDVFPPEIDALYSRRAAETLKAALLRRG